jgi:hypothetical protein
MIGRSLDPGLEDRLQGLAHIVGKYLPERRILYIRQVRLIALDRLFPLRSLEQANAMVGGLDGLDALVFHVAHPQGQSVVAQEPFVRIKINGIKDFAGGVVKRVRKGLITSQSGDIFGRDPKLKLNFRWPADHNE